MANSWTDLPACGGGGVASLNGLSGALTLVAGSGISIVPSGSNITISATATAALLSINSDTTAAQLLSVGTSGTDFAITNPGGGSHVFNLPTSSSSSRGALSSADWVTFNNKGVGSVTSVALSDASITPIYSISGSPIATSGTFTKTLVVQSANTIFSGPTTGGAAQPSFRSLVSADIPTVTSAKISDFSSTVRTTASSSATKKVIYVSQDVGNDANDGSIFLPVKTIQAGINAANTITAFYNQVIVLVSPPTTSNGYQENITLSQQGVILQAVSSLYRSDSLIKGTITINLTGTSGGANFIAANNYVYIHGFTLVASGADVIVFSGTTFQRLFISDCYVQSTSGGSAINMTNTGVNGVKSTITSRDTDYENNSSTLATFIVAAGRLFIAGSAPALQNNNAAGPSFTISGSSAPGVSVTCNNTDITGQILVSDNTASLTMSSYIVRSGSLPAIVTPSSPSTGVITIGSGALQTTATNSITGAGVLVPGGQNAKVSTGGDIVSTVTQVTLPKFPEGQTLLGAKATAVANSMLIIKDGHWTSQRTTALTATVNANAGTGAASTVANATDTAGVVNLTLGSVGTLSAGAQTRINFNAAYGTAPVVVLTPSNALTASNVGVFGVYVSSTTTTFSINFATAGVATSVLQWNYHAIETQ